VRHTIAKRMRAKRGEIKEALNRMRHLPVPEQGRWLGHVVHGYLAYHAVPTNARKITSFHHFVVWHWRRPLSRRSHKAAVS
jgi:RNA-directed DNA polymerase